MRTSFMTTSISMVTAFILAGILSPAFAAGGKDGSPSLSGRSLTQITRYRCTETYQSYPAQTYCATRYVNDPTHLGLFGFVANNSSHVCSYEAIGTPPNVTFGASTSNFMCAGMTTGVGVVGQVGGTKITGQRYWQNVVGGVRSVFTCEMVATCP